MHFVDILSHSWVCNQHNARLVKAGASQCYGCSYIGILRVFERGVAGGAFEVDLRFIAGII